MGRLSSVRQYLTEDGYYETCIGRDRDGRVRQVLTPSWRGPSGVVEDGERLGVLLTAPGCMEYEYDALGRLERVLRDGRPVARYGYDAAGRLHRVFVPGPGGDMVLQGSYDYYDSGHLARVQDADGNAARREYDAAGRLKELIDPAGSRTRISYDAAGRIERVARLWGAEGAVAVSFEYDAAGRLRALRGPRPGTGPLTWRRDPAGRVIEETDRAGRVTRYTWDAATGGLASCTLPDGRRLRWRRDGLGRVVRQERLSASGQVEHSTDILRDAAGGPLVLSWRGPGPGGRLSFAYDGLGRVTFRELSLSCLSAAKAVRLRGDAGGGHSKAQRPPQEGPCGAFLRVSETGCRAQAASWPERSG